MLKVQFCFTCKKGKKNDEKKKQEKKDIFYFLQIIILKKSSTATDINKTNSNHRFAAGSLTLSTSYQSCRMFIHSSVDRYTITACKREKRHWEKGREI